MSLFALLRAKYVRLALLFLIVPRREGSTHLPVAQRVVWICLFGENIFCRMREILRCRWVSIVCIISAQLSLSPYFLSWLVLRDLFQLSLVLLNLLLEQHLIRLDLVEFIFHIDQVGLILIWTPALTTLASSYSGLYTLLCTTFGNSGLRHSLFLLIRFGCRLSWMALTPTKLKQYHFFLFFDLCSNLLSLME